MIDKTILSYSSSQQTDPLKYVARQRRRRLRQQSHKAAGSVCRQFNDGFTSYSFLYIYILLWSSTCAFGSWAFLQTGSPFFRHSIHTVQLRNPKPIVVHRGREPETIRHVLTTPESIIEQASTQKLLDDLIDESVRTSARRPIMMQFDPSSGWIWKRWKGTVFSETWDSCVSKMVYASIVFFLCKTYPGIKQWLSGFNTLWGQLLSVTTFTLTFFVNQSYALWRKCYEKSRSLQGRLHDIDMALAAHAVRKAPTSPNEPSTYTAASRQILELVSRYVRLFNLLTYASFTRSHRPILTPRGMRRLVERGLMTMREREVLVDAEIPATQRHNAVLLWIVRTFVEGKEAGHFLGGAGFETLFMDKVHLCRAQYGAIGDELQGRMPLAYAHIVQVLVDMILWMYPFMAFSSGMSGLLCVLGTGLLTVSYQGLFDLAKQFLDPYDNESYGKGEDPLVVDTLIAETNAGSVRWMYGLEEYPVSAQRMKDGELSEYLLPIRGYSVEELEAMEQEKLEKEREIKEERRRKEEEKRKAKEAEQRVREAAKSIAEYQIDPTTLPTSSVIGLPGGTAFAVSRAKKLTGVLSSSSLTTARKVSEVIEMLPTLGNRLAEQLIPKETAPALETVVCINGLPETEVQHASKTQNVGDKTILGKDEIAVDEKKGHQKDSDQESTDDDEEYEFYDDLEGWDVNGDRKMYVHTFDSFDPYKDLPWHDHIGPDGKEVRLSQLLADEIWEEEIEAAKEKEVPIRTYEEYIKKVADLADEKKSELLETQRILMESPGDQSSYLPMLDIAEAPPKYDQTKLDGISQLWGLPPDDLSEIPSYQEPPVQISDSSFGGIAQLWGDSVGESPSGQWTGSTRKTLETNDSTFGGLAALWGQDIEDAPQPISTSGTRRIANDTEKVKPYEPVDMKEYRLSQILADEVWDEEIADASIQEPINIDDYMRQANEIMAEKQEELLETEAIMNAPPGADMLEVPDMDDTIKLVAANVTDQNEDELAALEMDAPTIATDDDLNRVQADNKGLSEKTRDAGTQTISSTGAEENPDRSNIIGKSDSFSNERTGAANDINDDIPEPKSQ